MKNFSPMKLRVLDHLRDKGISKKEFYENTGIPNGTLDKESGISEMFIEKYFSFYKEINPTWLVTGEGSMFRSSVIKPTNLVEEDEVTYGTQKNKIPLVSHKAVAGFGNGHFSIEQHDIKEYYVVPKFRHKKIDFMIEVEGSSMYPKYNSGDVVACTIISGEQFIQWNKVHVIVTREQGMIVKRVKRASLPGCFLMISDNKDYDAFEVPEDEITGMALVVGVIRLE